MIGAKTIVNSLIKYNIKTVFGVSGGAILPVLNEFYRNKQINFIQSRTELGGSFMAEGYAKATKTPGVVMVTSGPGAINTMTSMQNALSDGTPILALTGQVSTHVLGTDAFQEADIIGISKPCTKWNYIIKDGSVINSVIDQAFLHMLDKRHGPVLIDLPKNIMSVDTIQKNIKIKKSKHKKISSITSENILKMMFKKPNEDYVPNQVIITALNKLLILHADHEQNCSTSTVRIVGSSHAGLFASISAGISALWGPLHGGANQAVLEMLEAIKDDGGDTKKYMAKAKDKRDPFRLMGFGHRVYKNFDPRAKIIKKTCDDTAHFFYVPIVLKVACSNF